MLLVIGSSSLKSLVFFDALKIHQIDLPHCTQRTIITEKKIGKSSIFFLEQLDKNQAILAAFLCAKKIEISAILHICCGQSLSEKMDSGDFALITDYVNFNDQTPTTFANDSLIIPPVSHLQKNPVLSFVESMLKENLSFKTHLNSIAGCTNKMRLLGPQEQHILQQQGCGLILQNHLSYPYLSNQVAISYTALAITHQKNHSEAATILPKHANILIEIFKELSLRPAPFVPQAPFSTKAPFNALTADWDKIIQND